MSEGSLAITQIFLKKEQYISSEVSASLGLRLARSRRNHIGEVSCWYLPQGKYSFRGNIDLEGEKLVVWIEHRHKRWRSQLQASNAHEPETHTRA